MVSLFPAGWAGFPLPSCFSEEETCPRFLPWAQVFYPYRKPPCILLIAVKFCLTGNFLGCSFSFFCRAATFVILKFLTKTLIFFPPPPSTHALTILFFIPFVHPPPSLLPKGHKARGFYFLPALFFVKVPAVCVRPPSFDCYDTRPASLFLWRIYLFLCPPRDPFFLFKAAALVLGSCAETLFSPFDFSVLSISETPFSPPPFVGATMLFF